MDQASGPKREDRGIDVLAQADGLRIEHRPDGLGRSCVRLAVSQDRSSGGEGVAEGRVARREIGELNRDRRQALVEQQAQGFIRVDPGFAQASPGRLGEGMVRAGESHEERGRQAGGAVVDEPVLEIEPARGGAGADQRVDDVGKRIGHG